MIRRACAGSDTGSIVALWNVLGGLGARHEFSRDLFGAHDAERWNHRFDRIITDPR